MKNIDKKDTSETIIKLLTEYVTRNINIHANEIRCLLAIELQKFRKFIDLKVIAILNSDKSKIEKDILITTELVKMLKKIGSFDIIYFRESFITYNI